MACAGFKKYFRLVLRSTTLLLWLASLGLQAEVRRAVTLTISAGPLNAGSRSVVTLHIRSLTTRDADLEINVEIPGTAYVHLLPGIYQVSSKQAVQSGQNWLMWDLEVPVADGDNEVSLSEQNAIFFSDMPDKDGADIASSDKATETVSDSSVGASTPSPPAASNTEQSDSARSEPPLMAPVNLSSPRTSLERGVVQLLNNWLQAVERHDIDALMACYAPRMSRYFLRSDVSSSEVRRDKESFFRKYPKIRKLQIRDLRIYPTPEGAAVTLTKTWEFEGKEPFSGEVISRLTLQNYHGRLYISSERERAIWVSRSPDRAIVFVPVKPTR